MSRVINVTAGDSEYLVAKVTERNKQSLDTTTWQLGIGSTSERPATWASAVVLPAPSVGVARLALLIGGGGYVTPGTKRSLWVKATDSPESFAFRASNDTVDIV